MKYEIKTFSDGQVGSRITEPGNLVVRIRGNTYTDLFKAASIKEAWDNNDIANTSRGSHFAVLEILCLIGQRSDRRFNPGESFDLRVIADFINRMNFDEVRILHPHSSVSLALINRSKAIDHYRYIEKAYNDLDQPVLVSPDAGAYKVSHEVAHRLNANLIPANKVRRNGEPEIKLQGGVQGKRCLIIDDIADGGRTFINLARVLRDQGAEEVNLYVTHGMFNYGFDEFNDFIDHIYCTNSYRDIDHPLVTQYEIEEL